MYQALVYSRKQNGSGTFDLTHFTFQAPVSKNCCTRMNFAFILLLDMWINSSVYSSSISALYSGLRGKLYPVVGVFGQRLGSQSPHVHVFILQEEIRAPIEKNCSHKARTSKLHRKFSFLL